MNLKEVAASFVAKTISNISVLDRVPTDVSVEERKFKEGTPEEYECYIATIKGEDFYVPVSVLAQLQELIKVMPDIKAIKITKVGEGMNTRYTVIPLRD